jgi:single-stranded DNA-binding protein
MPTIVIADGKIDGDVRVNTVGTPPKKVAEFRVDTGDGWYIVVAWQELADQVPPTGASILVHGRLRTRSYEKDGSKRYVTEIVASQIERLGSGPALPARNPPADDSIFTD